MQNNQKIIGIWQQIPLPMISRFLAKMGWEWIILDMQHGCMSPETAYECIHTIRAHGARPIVRTSIGAPAEVQRALDLGAGGVVVPMVNSAPEARVMAEAAKYPPRGGRSVGGDNFYTQDRKYLERADDDTVLLVQIEHIDAVNVVDDILGVDGVDGCFVGPTDLALSMGLGRTGFESNPAHRAAIQKTVDTCRRLGKLAASNSYSLAEAGEKAAQGYDFVTLRSDGDLFWDAATHLLQGMHEQVQGVGAGAETRSA
jgi:2-keto-3-deoxy-L-rhamnonate aldolase RhmA